MPGVAPRVIHKERRKVLLSGVAGLREGTGLQTGEGGGSSPGAGQEKMKRPHHWVCVCDCRCGCDFAQSRGVGSWVGAPVLPIQEYRRDLERGIV